MPVGGAGGVGASGIGAGERRHGSPKINRRPSSSSNQKKGTLANFLIPMDILSNVTIYQSKFLNKSLPIENCYYRLIKHALFKKTQQSLPS